MIELKFLVFLFIEISISIYSIWRTVDNNLFELNQLILEIESQSQTIQPIITVFYSDQK